jgi:hypothetical protein
MQGCAYWAENMSKSAYLGAVLYCTVLDWTEQLDAGLCLMGRKYE